MRWTRQGKREVIKAARRKRRLKPWQRWFNRPAAPAPTSQRPTTTDQPVKEIVHGDAKICPGCARNGRNESFMGGRRGKNLARAPNTVDAF